MTHEWEPACAAYHPPPRIATGRNSSALHLTLKSPIFTNNYLYHTTNFLEPLIMTTDTVPASAPAIVVPMDAKVVDPVVKTEALDKTSTGSNDPSAANDDDSGAAVEVRECVDVHPAWSMIVFQHDGLIEHRNEYLNGETVPLWRIYGEVEIEHRDRYGQTTHTTTEIGVTDWYVLGRKANLSTDVVHGSPKAEVAWEEEDISELILDEEKVLIGMDSVKVMEREMDDLAKECQVNEPRIQEITLVEAGEAYAENKDDKVDEVIDVSRVGLKSTTSVTAVQANQPKDHSWIGGKAWRRIHKVARSLLKSIKV